MALLLRVDLDNLTFGDIYGFADIGRAAGVDPETKIDTFPASDMDPDRGPGGFEAEVTVRGYAPPVTLPPADARELASVLDSVIEQEGDARAALAELRQWRDRLVGLYED